MLDHRYPFPLDNSLVEKWCFRSWTQSYSEQIHSVLITPHGWLNYLRYAPGDFCIFYSSVIYHQVAPFIPDTQNTSQAEQRITPGRIGTVFFFPKNSLEVLQNKPKKWAYRTGFGMNDDLV